MWLMYKAYTRHMRSKVYARYMDHRSQSQMQRIYAYAYAAYMHIRSCICSVYVLHMPDHLRTSSSNTTIFYIVIYMPFICQNLSTSSVSLKYLSPYSLYISLLPPAHLSVVSVCLYPPLITNCFFSLSTISFCRESYKVERVIT